MSGRSPGLRPERCCGGKFRGCLRPLPPAARPGSAASGRRIARSRRRTFPCRTPPGRLQTSMVRSTAGPTCRNRWIRFPDLSLPLRPRSLARATRKPRGSSTSRILCPVRCGWARRRVSSLSVFHRLRERVSDWRRRPSNSSCSNTARQPRTRRRKYRPRRVPV